jgi:NADH:ubiquinone oxidoreductase subunit K
MGLTRDAERVRDRIEHGDPFWPAQVAIAAAIGLNFVLTKRVTIGPRYLLPSVELLLLVALIVVAPRRATKHSQRRRRLALFVIGFVSLTNVVSLGLLVHYLLKGGKAGGEPLILSGTILWITNVLLFSVWYWEFDRGGPVERFQQAHGLPDFQFPQMENPQFAPLDWRPGFGDYLYTSLTNATAFSPTDTMPLTQIAKLMMGIQSVSALVTIGLVVARAVNILS